MALVSAAVAVGTAIAGAAAAAAPVLTAAGAIAGVAGTAMSMRAQQQAVRAQRRQENLRQQQMRLEADRRRRDIIRNSTIASSTSLANMTAAGAQFGSALPGAQAGIFGQAGRQTAAVGQNLQIGEGLFQANMDLFSANASNAFWQGVSQTGSQMIDFSKTWVNNMPAIDRLANNSSPVPPWQTQVYGGNGQFMGLA